jgi:hypothetical protein
VGYVPRETFYTLTWEAGEYEGLEVVCRSASTRVYEAIAGLMAVEHTVPPSVEALAATARAADAFAGQIVSWNVERPDGTPVPATAESLLDLPPLMVSTVMATWMDALVGARPAAAPPEPEFDESDLPMATVT